MAAQAFNLPHEPPPWSKQVPASQVKPHTHNSVLSAQVAQQLAALDTGPRTFHQSDEMYVKAHVFFKNNIFKSRRLSQQLVRALQKRAVIVDSPHMVNDWRHDIARRGAEGQLVNMPAKRSSRRFVCLSQAYEALQSVRVGTFGRKLSTEERYRVNELLAEFKRVSENRYACAFLLAEQKKTFSQRRAQLQGELDACVARVWHDQPALQLQRDIQQLAHLSRPLDRSK